MKTTGGLICAAFATAAMSLAGPAKAADICQGYGPQTPRDISMKSGSNPRVFTLAPPASEMNLCNIHTHTNAEHKGPGYTVSAGTGEHGGFKCNETASLTEAELKDPADGHGAFHGIKPGDTIEVHWVHTSCDVKPGKGLGSCLSEACANPQLRVEAQVSPICCMSLVAAHALSKSWRLHIVPENAVGRRRRHLHLLRLV